jgi:hypothetical protein
MLWAIFGCDAIGTNQKMHATPVGLSVERLFAAYTTLGHLM